MRDGEEDAPLALDGQELLDDLAPSHFQLSTASHPA